jgi:hypothetical protein
MSTTKQIITRPKMDQMALKNYKSEMNKNFPIFQGFQPYCSRPNMQREELKNY